MPFETASIECAGDNLRDLASGLSYVQVDKHGITILDHLHQCIPCIHAKDGKGGIKTVTLYSTAQKIMTSKHYVILVITLIINAPITT